VRRRTSRHSALALSDESREHASGSRRKNGRGDDQFPSPLSLGPDENDEDVDAADDCAEAANRLVELSSRFVGDLNPEGILIEATAPVSASADARFQPTSDLGRWFPQRSGETPTGSPVATKQNYGVSKAAAKSEKLIAFEKARREYLLADCLPLLPPPEHYRALKAIFLKRIHPLLPVFREKDLADDLPLQVSAVYQTLVRQIVALTAAADRAATKHLFLESNARKPMQFQTFQKRLSGAIIAVLDAELIHDRFELIRVLVMLAFYYQPSGPSDRNRAALFLSQAVYHFQTLGAHLVEYRSEDQDEHVEELFCALWAVDRLCASFYARPCLMHDRDFDRDLDDMISRLPPAFQLFMKVIQALSQVFTLYRPRQPFVFIDIEVYEALIMASGAEKLPTVILGTYPQLSFLLVLLLSPPLTHLGFHLVTIEMLYHAVCVLSARQPPSAFAPGAPVKDLCHIPHPTVNPRRSLSADRITWIAQNQEICPFPFAPYAVTLALSVQYRKMRYSRTAMFRSRARSHFKSIVKTLRGMGDVWYSARVNAGLGESILQQMEKTASSLVREDGENAAAAGSRRMGTAMATPTEKTPGSASVVYADPASVPVTVVPPSADVLLESSLQPDLGTMDLSCLDNLDMDAGDLFGLFDPNFNLGAIDTALEANLDMGIPQNWTATWDYPAPPL